MGWWSLARSLFCSLFYCIIFYCLFDYLSYSIAFSIIPKYYDNSMIIYMESKIVQIWGIFAVDEERTKEALDFSWRVKPIFCSANSFPNIFISLELHLPKLRRLIIKEHYIWPKYNMQYSKYKYECPMIALSL